MSGNEYEILAIIEFAIDKEQEAVDFYNDLASRITKEAISKEMVNMAKMEEGHRQKLVKIKDSDFVDFQNKQIEKAKAVDLKITDYQVDKMPDKDMSFKDLVQIAMKRELAAKNLYTDLAKLSVDESSKDLFGFLANEEDQHKQYFESIWDEEVMLEN